MRPKERALVYAWLATALLAIVLGAATSLIPALVPWAFVLLAIEFILGHVVLAVSNKVSIQQTILVSPSKKNETLTFYRLLKQNGFAGRDRIALLKDEVTRVIDEKEHRKEMFANRIIQTVIGGMLFLLLNFIVNLIENGFDVDVALTAAVFFILAFTAVAVFACFLRNAYENIRDISLPKLKRLRDDLNDILVLEEWDVQCQRRSSCASLSPTTVRARQQYDKLETLGTGRTS
ncbi:hypothetical protein [Gordonibacter sp. 28C]|uniref:hypothetical protein n=1 Tax=Gordonibacter sp. 28C TaxID=2078569 RepID=UPI0011C03743|nr:hypothetical protein [Gordonibacter sp. 28C]